MLLHELFDYFAAEQPEAECIVFGETSLTYAAAQAEAHRVAHALIASGVTPGQRVAVLAKNCPELVLFYLGCFKAGAVPVPLNYRLAPPEWQFIVGDADAVLLVARGELVAAVDAVRGELPAVREWIAIDAAPPPGWRAWDAWLDGQPATAPPRAVAAAHDAYQMYTSGTTGLPKGAVIAHAALLANVLQINAVSPVYAGERVLIVAPLYHAAAALSAFRGLACGAALFVQEDFAPAAAVQALANERIAVALLVPAMIQACLVAVPDVAARRYPTLRVIVYGASPIGESTLRRAIEVFDCDFVQGYGMTETTACATGLSPAAHRRALRDAPHLLQSAGRAIPATELRILAADGQPAAPGEVGEVLVRGPQLMRGYWKRPEANADSLRDGWMHTGDAGRLDDEGFLFIEDRVKDMIVSGGENVYPREVENVLLAHPAVADAAVIGIPDPRWGEAVKAIVVLRAGAAASADDIVGFCRGKLGGYKLPRSVDFLDALPRNPSGKVLKRVLREPYWKDQTRGVA
ncbi:MAG: long-chain-fatty-acid--CoA ligase [Deltaproteobacteria bacterium]|nr:long-chain-fatty-acid--CoA ligase [Deltaproteobacteria bacterium]